VGPWVAAENALARRLTVHFVGLRQEEHSMFADAVIQEAEKLLELIDRDVIPRDARIALSPVGAIPYMTRLWTLDRLGLCDAYVARLPAASSHASHGKFADSAYLASRGVDLEAAHTFHFVENDAIVREAPSNNSFCTPASPCYVSRLGPDRNLLVRLPAGEANARTKFPHLEFHRLQ
jgi:hypothetical protein